MPTNYSFELKDALEKLKNPSTERAFLRCWNDIVGKQLLVNACQHAIHQKDYDSLKTWQQDFAECKSILTNLENRKMVNQHSTTWLDAIFACAQAASSAQENPDNLRAFGKHAQEALRAFAVLQDVQLPAKLSQGAIESETSLVDAGYTFFAQQGCPVGAAWELTRWLQLGEKRPTERTRTIAVLGCSDDHRRGWPMFLTVELVKNGHGNWYFNLPEMAFVEWDATFQAALLRAGQYVRGQLQAGMDVRWQLQAPQYIHTHQGGSLGGAFAVALLHLFQAIPIPHDVALTADVKETGELLHVAPQSIPPKVEAASKAELSALIVHPDNEATARRAVVTQTTNTRLVIQTAETVEEATEIFAAAIRPNELPQMHKDFIGRAELLTKLCEHIHSGGVTILKGEGGIGKTELLLKAVHDAYADGKLPGGVAWLNCRLQPNHDECLRQMAHVFFGNRMENEHIERCHERIMNHLRERNALVVFDSFEMVESNDELLSWLAKIKPPATALVTTRQMTPGLYGQVIAVPELPRKEAVQLFSNRAKANGWDGHEEHLVNDLCAAVGDLPLAIELLAARTPSLTPGYLLDKVQQNLKVLKSVKRNPTMPKEHISVEACFALSYEQLSPSARNLLLRFSVLPDGAGTEVITAITGTEDWGDTVEELVSSSMRRLKKGRYSMHLLVRRFALEKLMDKRANVELEVARAVTKVAQAKGELTMPAEVDPDDMKAALDWIETEWHNLIACANIAVKAEDWDTVGRLSDAVGEFFQVRGHWADCKRLYEDVLGKRDCPAEARTLRYLGKVVYRLQGRSEAEEYYKQSLNICQQVDDQHKEQILNTQGQVLNDLGSVYRYLERWAEAEMYYQQSLAIRQEIGDSWGEGQVLNNIGNLYRHQEIWTKAEEYYLQSLAICLKFKYLRTEGQVRNNLGNVHRNLGNVYRNQKLCEKAVAKYQEAVVEYQRGLEIRRELRDRVSEGKTLRDFAKVYEDWGKLKKALELMREAVSVLKTTEDTQTLEEVTKWLAELESQE
jgi:predicted ATPase